MFAEERKNKIIELLQLRKRVTILELTETFKASEATIRRDLQELENKGLLKRTHGGAILQFSVSHELAYSEKEFTSSLEKKNIAKAASQFIEDNDVIILDSGTTTLQLIPFIKDKNLTIITNSVVAASMLALYANISTILVAGKLRSISKALVGSLANDTFAKMNAYKAFLGANGFDLVKGASTPNIEEAETKKAMIKAADLTFILLDSSKFNERSLVNFAKISDIQYVVTDDKVSSSVISVLHEQGVKVIT